MVSKHRYTHDCCITCVCSLLGVIPVAQVLQCWAGWASAAGWGCHSGGRPLCALLLRCGNVSPAVWASLSESILHPLPVQLLQPVLLSCFCWDGSREKMTQMLELCLSGAWGSAFAVLRCAAVDWGVALREAWRNTGSMTCAL